MSGSKRASESGLPTRCRHSVATGKRSCPACALRQAGRAGVQCPRLDVEGRNATGEMRLPRQSGCDSSREPGAVRGGSPPSCGFRPLRTEPAGEPARLPRMRNLESGSNAAESPRRGVGSADVSGDTPCVGLGHVPRRSIALPEREDAGKAGSDRTRFHGREIPFGKLRPCFHDAGVASVVDGMRPAGVVVVVPREPRREALALPCPSPDEFVDCTDRTSPAARMPRANRKTTGRRRVRPASKHVVHAFRGMVRPHPDPAGANVRESRAFARIRDLLLPKPRSGETRLPDVGRVVKAAAQ